MRETALGRKCAALRRPMIAAGAGRVTAGFGMYEDSGEAFVIQLPPGAAPGLARLLEFFDLDSLLEPGYEGTWNTNEGCTGDIVIDFEAGWVFADTYRCRYSDQLDGDYDYDTGTDSRTYTDPPEGGARPKYASPRWGHDRDRYYAPDTQILGPDSSLYEFDPDPPEETLVPFYVFGIGGFIAGEAPPAVLADYLDDADARPGPTYPALAAALRAADELTPEEFARLGLPEYDDDEGSARAVVRLAPETTLFVVGCTRWSMDEPAPAENGERPYFSRYSIVSGQRLVLAFTSSGPSTGTGCARYFRLDGAPELIESAFRDAVRADPVGGFDV